MFTNRPWRAAFFPPHSTSMLALLLLLHHATANDHTQESYIIEKIVSCPDVGYYFKRDLHWNAIEPACRLCFCRENGTAVCWRRELSRCDVQHFHHFRDKKRHRIRRSPGLAEVFFRDAAKDVFNKNTPEECKPYESSYSEGCPPADWCLGCTVCDCDANGRWDCHTLSFCTDDKGKKKIKKNRNKITKPQALKKKAPTTIKKQTLKTSKKPNKYHPPKNINKAKGKQLRQNNESQSKLTKKPNKLKNVILVKKAKAPVYKKKATPKKNEKSNSKIIKKTLQPSSVQIVKGNTKTLKENEEVMRDIAHTIYKKVMAAVEKIVMDSQKNISHKKIIQKRSMPKDYKIDKVEKVNTVESKKIQNMREAPNHMKNHQSLSSHKGKRSKREITTKISTANDTNTTEESFVYQSFGSDVMLATPIVEILTKSNYFKYTVDLKLIKVNSTKNFTKIQKERFPIPGISKNAKNEAILNVNVLPLNTSNVRYHYFEGKIFNNFTKELINISNSLNVNITGSKNISSKTNHCNDNFSFRTNTTCGKVCNFKKLFKNLVVFDNKKTTMNANKIKNLNIMKYLKKVFRKKYHKENVKDTMTCKRHLVRTICNNFGFCKIDLHSKDISSKFDMLKAESNKIMKSINGIKGILKLLQIPSKKNKDNLANLNKQFIKNYFEKLHVIVKDKSEEYNLNDLTETQNVQVAYIKQNHKIFMHSMENFAHILNDIVQNKPNRKIYYPKVLDHYFINRNNHTVIKATTVNVNKNNTIEQKLDRIKALLLNYRLVQNKFMKRMYDVIMSLELKTNKTKDKEKHMKVSNECKNNDKVALEVYTKNIIENLRKLKNLAQKFSIKNRTKREAMEDDGVVEYLLILMEYLLKQKKQLRISPVSDGIDLLIDAIKSAPDIKATRKKVLEYVPARIGIETTESILTLPNAMKMDETSTAANYAVPKFKTFESMDEDEESSDYYQYNKNVHKSNNVKIKEMPESEDTVYSSTSLSNNEKNNMATKNKDNGKGYELFTDEPDEDDGAILTTTKPLDIIRESVTFHIPTRITPLVILENEQSTAKPSKDAAHRNQNSRIKLSWIEESYNQEEERKELPRFIETTTQKLSPTHTALVFATRTRVNKKAKLSKYDDPISSISKETTDEESKITKHSNSEYVMHKKQMNLLNSLDYGTEKIDMDGDSKEDKPNVEQFPLYFV